ncbi:MAG TPA: hypothetical protein DGJ56_04330 [Verrucomicrobiales bacterium]|nr:hypothetical protein [Verrucomicrobiales bacterium]
MLVSLFGAKEAFAVQIQLHARVAQLDKALASELEKIVRSVLVSSDHARSRLTGKVLLHISI